MTAGSDPRWIPGATRWTLLGGCLLAAFIAVPLHSAPLHAQERSVSNGLRVNVHAGAALLGGDAGNGLNVRPGVSAAYGNSRLFSVFATYDRVPMNDGTLDFDMRHLDLGVRVWLRGADASLVPFALASYTWRSADYGTVMFLGEMMHLEVHGGGLTAGAGAAYYFTPRLAVEASVKRTGGSLDRVNANGLAIRHEQSHIEEASYRLNIGMSWWIGRSPAPTHESQ